MEVGLKGEKGESGWKRSVEVATPTPVPRRNGCDSMKPRSSSRSAFPLTLLFIVMAAVMVMVYLMLPDQEELLKRLVADENLERATVVLKGISNAKKEANPDFYVLVNAKLDRQEKSKKDPKGFLDSHDVRNLLLSSWQQYGRRTNKGEFLKEMGYVLSRSRDYEKSAKLLEPLAVELPDWKLGEFEELVVAEALKINNPAAAASVLRVLADRTENPNQRRIKQQVGLWRAAGLPAEALKDVDHRLDFLRGAGEETGDLLELKVVLLQELGRTGEILALTRTYESIFQKMWGEKKLILFQASMAVQSGQQAEALALYERILTGEPDNREVLVLAGPLAAGLMKYDKAIAWYQKMIDQNPGSADNRQMLAQIYEWSGKPGEAFDIYRELAAQKNLFALARMMALNPGLYRDDELLHALEAVAPNKGTSPELLPLADMLTRRGDYARAEKLYLQHLKVQPRDADVLLKLGRIQDVQEHLEEALVTFQKILEVTPDLAEARTGVVGLMLAVGREEEAMDLARQWVEADTAPVEVIQYYINDREGRGDFKTVTRGYEKLLAHSKEVTPQDYSRLAYTYNMIGQPDKARETLSRGREENSDDVMLGLQLARAESEKGDYARALEILRPQAENTEDPALQIFYMDLQVQNNQTIQALKYLNTRVDPLALVSDSLLATQAAAVYEAARKLPAAAAMRKQLYESDRSSSIAAIDYARVLHKLERAREAREILETLNLKENPEDVLKTAYMYLDVERYRDAVKLLEFYGRLTPDQGMRSLRSLGDARLSSGDPQGAKRAYRRSLAVLLKKPEDVAP